MAREILGWTTSVVTLFTLLLCGGLAGCAADEVTSSEELRRHCGNGRCGTNESCSTCPADCGACPSGDGGGSSGSDSGSSASTDSGSSGSTDSGSTPTRSCTSPVFVTSDTNGGWSTAGYYVHNNMWNSTCCETLYACAYNNWYVVSNQINEAGAVKTYPNVHRDYASRRISSFSRLTSTFAMTSPHVGIYNVAYDLWINGIAARGGAELMIWTENFHQVPGGSIVAHVDLGGVRWDVWKGSWDWTYIAFVPATPMTSGRLDLLEMLNWIIAQGWIRSDSTVDQVGYGVEIVSTEGRDERFTLTDFSIDDGT